MDDEVPRGVRFALDLGKARIGVAATDAAGLLAFPVETVAARPDPLPRLRDLVGEYEPTAVIVGLPRTLAGNDGIAAADIRAQAAILAAALNPIPVGLVDERLTTALASKRLSSVGKSTKAQRSVIDQAAAVAILDGVLEAERGGKSRWERVWPQAETGTEEDT